MAGFKSFKEDVRQARDESFKCISDVNLGELEGEMSFIFSHELLDESVKIHVIVSEVDEYPRVGSFMLYTTTESPPAFIANFLTGYSAKIKEKSLRELMELVSQKLTAKLEDITDGSKEQDCGEIGQEEDDDEYEDEEETDMNYISHKYSCADDSDDEAFFLSFSEDEDDNQFAAKPVEYRLSSFQDLRSPVKPDIAVKRLKASLLKVVKSAPICLRSIPQGRINPNTTFALSIRVTELGLPADALEAWEIPPEDYFMMLYRCSSGCPRVSDFVQLPSHQKLVEFRIGRCGKPRPSNASVKAAFDRGVGLGIPLTFAGDTAKPWNSGDEFTPIEVSNSINDLLNKQFPALLRNRRKHDLSWEESQAKVFRLIINPLYEHGIIEERKEGEGGEEGEEGEGEGEVEEEEKSEEEEVVGDRDEHSAKSNVDDFPISSSVPDALHRDFALDDDQSFSIPLVAMQYALRRFVHCTRYCMVCHGDMQEERRAIKPYVCSNQLCLYQYITLGLGPSIENEIVQSPFVVDILVSFFHAAACRSSLRGHPSGLGLKTISYPSTATERTTVKATYRFLTETVKIHTTDTNLMKEGDPVGIEIPKMFKHKCRVRSVGAASCILDILATTSEPTVTCWGERNGSAPPPLDVTLEDAPIFFATQDIDDLGVAEMQNALRSLVLGIPSILQMREYLVNRHGQLLSSYRYIDQQSLTLLRWIISSNRSLILQNDVVPAAGFATAGHTQPAFTSVTNTNRVLGVPQGFMQFRFVQGTPESEKRFVKEVESAQQQHGQYGSSPTFFAWHGSALHNWHSIIKTGLDFKEVVNGRANGHGVYFSSCMQTSLGYCTPRSAPGTELSGNCWPNSELRPERAISVCELIDLPEEFVSIRPHYVVDKLDWIQCRYLFVNVNPTEKALANASLSLRKGQHTGYVPHGAKPLWGFQGKQVSIPLSALSVSKLANAGNLWTGTQGGGAKADKKRMKNQHQERRDNKREYALLFGDVSGFQSKSLSQTHKRKHSDDTSDMDSDTSSKLDSEAHDKKMANKPAPKLTIATDFKPGTLDLNSLPKLPPPPESSGCASALRILSRHVRDMQRTQRETDIGTLGWYVNFDELNNLFHWIVELHSFEPSLPLAQDMKRNGRTSIVLELRFGGNFPYSPPFARVIRPRLLPFIRGGGGHVTAGGSVCSEILTSSGWSPAMTIEYVLLQIRLGMSDKERPARLDSQYQTDYGLVGAISAYNRAAGVHGWAVPQNFLAIANGDFSK